MSRKNRKENKLKRIEILRSRETDQELKQAKAKKNREIKEQERQAEEILENMGLDNNNDWEDEDSNGMEVEKKHLKAAGKQKKIKKTKRDYEVEKKKNRKMKNKPIIITNDDMMSD